MWSLWVIESQHWGMWCSHTERRAWRGFGIHLLWGVWGGGWLMPSSSRFRRLWLDSRTLRSLFLALSLAHIISLTLTPDPLLRTPRPCLPWRYDYPCPSYNRWVRRRLTSLRKVENVSVSVSLSFSHIPFSILVLYSTEILQIRCEYTTSVE